MSLTPVAIHTHNNSLLNIDPSYEENGNYEYSTEKNLDLYPSTKNEDPDSIFLGGAPGSGKTHFFARYILHYKDIFPKNRVFVFTPKPNDKSLEPIRGLPNVQIININAKTPNDDYYFMEHYAGKDASFFKNSLVFIDDRVGVLDKAVKKALDTLDEQLIKVGREFNVTVGISHHELTDHHFTRDLLACCKYIVAFPRGGGHRIFKNYMKNYYGLKDDEMKNLLEKNSRWLVFTERIPKFVLHEHGLKML